MKIAGPWRHLDFWKSKDISPCWVSDIVLGRLNSKHHATFRLVAMDSELSKGAVNHVAVFEGEPRREEIGFFFEIDGKFKWRRHQQPEVQVQCAIFREVGAIAFAKKHIQLLQEMIQSSPDQTRT